MVISKHFLGENRRKTNSRKTRESEKKLKGAFSSAVVDFRYISDSPLSLCSSTLTLFLRSHSVFPLWFSALTLFLYSHSVSPLCFSALTLFIRSLFPLSLCLVRGCRCNQEREVFGFTLLFFHKYKKSWVKLYCFTKSRTKKCVKQQKVVRKNVILER